MKMIRTTREGCARSNPLVAVRLSRVLMAVPGLVVLVALGAGCPATGDEIRPPDNSFYFPTGMDKAPDESVLFVANANSDLRYDSGAALVVDLAWVDGIISAWVNGGGAVPDGMDCEVDLMVPYTLICDEGEVIRDGAGVRIGNFATELKVQTMDNPNALRLFGAVRGDPSLTWIDYDAGDRTLSCGGSGSFPECNDEHRLNQLRNDEDLIALPDEPFGLFVDSDNGYVVMTHLANGAVSLAEAPRDGDAPILADAVGNLFAPNPDTGERGAVGAAGRLPGSASDRIYVTSRREARVQTLVVVPGSSGYRALVPAEFFFMRGAVGNSSDGRGIAFSADGQRAYIVNRAPPMLHIVDTSMDVLGVPRNEFVAGVEVCPEASNLAIADVGAGERIFVACFRNGQVWSIDPRGAVVDAIIDVGRGPTALVAAPLRKRLYVSNNLESTVAVVDLTPEAVTQNRVVLRLGRPRSPGDDVE